LSDRTRRKTGCRSTSAAIASSGESGRASKYGRVTRIFSTDRQLIELLTELRVALPGVQVLLGFLLTAPLASRFGRTSELDRGLLYLCTVVTSSGVLFLMAPSLYHRIRWEERGRQDVVAIRVAKPTNLRPLRAATLEPVPVRPQRLPVWSLRLQLEHLPLQDHHEPPRSDKRGISREPRESGRA
jgi:hypothetical protein